MARILVKEPFILLMSLSERLTFEPGVHEVSDEVAAHWYTRDHATPLDGEAEPEQASAEPEPEPVAVEPAEADGLDTKSDDELRELIKARDGRYPHPATGRDKLLAAAGGDATVAAEIEAEPEVVAETTDGEQASA